MLTSTNPIKPMVCLPCKEPEEERRCSRPLGRVVIEECCVVDGDAPPERFDHERTLTDESVLRDTHPNVLRTNGFDQSQSQSQIPVPVGHRSARLPSPLAAWPKHHELKRTRLQGDQRRFFDIHKFRSRPNLGLLYARLFDQFTTFRVRIPVALTQLASASISARSGMQMQPVPG